MKLEKYKVERLEVPEGNITHKLVYESISKNKGSGGFGYGIRHKGTYRECLEIKKEIEDGIRESKETSSLVSTKTQNNK